MHITGMRLLHFGAFSDTGWLHFKPGLNLVVGQNNVGKSSLLEALRPSLSEVQHISLEAFRIEDRSQPYQEVEISLGGAEIKQTILRANIQVAWPLESNLADVSPEAIDREILGNNRYTCRIRRTPNGYLVPEGLPTHLRFDRPPELHILLGPNRPNVICQGQGHGGQDGLPELIRQRWHSHMFWFDAQRHAIGECQQQDVRRLRPDAADLPAFLHILRGARPNLFEKIVEQLRFVIPSIYSITTLPVGNDRTRIMVWPTKNMAEPEHAFELNRSGTGVSQVLAIITAVATSEPALIVIDEINSFLHPSAAKALIRLLQSEYGQHQYVISTHSPEVISAGKPASIHLVERNGFESVVRPIDLDNVVDLRELADTLGISVSDVFAADFILWVEGRTEEQCYSLLKMRALANFPANTIISPVASTGDFFSGKRDIELVLQVYDRLSRGTLPLVKGLAFAFDREDLTREEVGDFIKRAGGNVSFLPRRHLECYLVHPGAISALINAIDEGRAESLRSEEVEAWLQAHAGERGFRAADRWRGQLTDSVWAAEVDAANLIKACIGELTAHRCSNRKGEHSVWLLDHILEHDPGHVAEFVEHASRLAGLLRGQAG
jgi:energy-coupling factor transporter ATP-binding protein EcfA2